MFQWPSSAFKNFCLTFISICLSKARAGCFAWSFKGCGLFQVYLGSERYVLFNLGQMILHIFSLRDVINEKDLLTYSLVAVRMATLLPFHPHSHTSSRGEKAVSHPSELWVLINQLIKHFGGWWYIVCVVGLRLQTVVYQEKGKNSGNRDVIKIFHCSLSSILLLFIKKHHHF